MAEGYALDGLIPDSAPSLSMDTGVEEPTPEVGSKIESDKNNLFSDPDSKIAQDVINSGIGVATLLKRLKQSVASAKEFATFLKKRSILEEEHSIGLKKLCRTTADSIKKPDHRNGSFLTAYEDVTIIHEQMAENGAKFSLSLHQMHDDLMGLATNMERIRKHWKIAGLSAEQKVADAEAAVKKSKIKYDTLVEDYKRAKTGDRQGAKLFGLKGHKSAAQYVEDLRKKAHAADGDYAIKVQVAQNHREDLWSKSRPETVKVLEDLIKECDSALTLQMQKFASYNEKLLLSNGLNIHPINETDEGNQTRSLRDVVYSIDNDRDLSDYLISFADKIPPRISDIKYERNSILNRAAQRQSDQSTYFPKQGPPHQTSNFGPNSQVPSGNQPTQAPGSTVQKHERNSNQISPGQQFSSRMATKGVGAGSTSIYNSNSNSANYTRSLQLSSVSYPYSPIFSNPPQTQTPNKHHTYAGSTENLPALKPVFGVSLDLLFERDGSAVPMVVYQCIQAVDLFGLEVEGIYRLSGTASQVTKIKSLFDNDASMVDFRDPANFFHDVNSVAGLLKQFFRDLPDPLLTSEQYLSFIEAAKNEDDLLRRDSLHAIINNLPDPNYATLRAVILHLNRVQENSTINRMNISNLAIVFGPTLMGASTGSNIQNAGWQVKVIDTILQNCYQIFDDD